jgi:hypothetical protein
MMDFHFAVLNHGFTFLLHYDFIIKETVTEKTRSFLEIFPKSSKKSLGSGIWQKKNRVGRVTGNTYFLLLA